MVRWLNGTEQRAWRALISLVQVGLPQLEATFRRYDLLHVEYGLLVALSETPDDALRMSDLARAASMSQSRLSHRMRRLVDRGLIEQRPCTEDGRVTYAVLTTEGRALIEAVAPEHVADVRALIFDALDNEQTLALAEALEAVRDGSPPPEPSTDQSA